MVMGKTRLVSLSRIRLTFVRALRRDLNIVLPGKLTQTHTHGGAPRALTGFDGEVDGIVREFGGGLEKKSTGVTPFFFGSRAADDAGSRGRTCIGKAIGTDVGGLDAPSLLRNLSQPRASTC